MLKLIIEDDQKQVKVVKLLRDEITIGRKEGNTIRLTDRNVSRFHARIIHKDGRFIIEDRKSYNGVYVNGKRVNGSAEISPGDKIKIGDYILMLKVDSEEKQPDPFEEMKTVPLEQVDKSSLEQPTPASVEEEIPASEAYKLGVLSTNLAGNVYYLTKKVTIIGRTPDNDIVLDHKSISRHHARIERDGDIYTIYDLDSSNGVRINGEQYKKMALRKGDIIDLGHVRLKFLAPNEELNLAEELLPKKTGSHLGLILGGVAVAVAILVIGAFWMFSGGEEEGEGDSGAVVEKYNSKMEEINNLIANKQWDRAEAEILTFSQASTLPPTLKEELAKKRKEIQEEKKHGQMLQESERLLTQDDKGAWLKALKNAGAIPKWSVYYGKAREVKNSAIKRLRNHYEELARVAAKKGECEEIRSYRNEFSKVMPPQEELVGLDELLAECQKAKPTAVASAENAAPAEEPGSGQPEMAPAVVPPKQVAPKPAVPAAPAPPRARPPKRRAERKRKPVHKSTAGAKKKAASGAGGCPAGVAAKIYKACKGGNKKKGRSMLRRYQRCINPGMLTRLKMICK